MVTMLIARGSTPDPGGNALAPGMLTAMNALACVGLLTAMGLLVAGRDAGRSAIVWLAVVVLPWVLVTGVFFALGMEVALDGRRAYDTALRGLGGVGLATVGLIVAAVLLGLRPGRRWLAHGVRSRATGPGGSTAPPAGPRFLTGLVVIFTAGVGVLVAMPLSGMRDDPDLAGTVVVLSVLHLAFVSAPLLVAGLSAGAGRVVLARVFSAVPLLLLPVLVLVAGFVGVAGARNDGAVLPPVVSVAVGVLLTVAFLAGLGLVLAGLAALADPRPRTA